MRIQELARDAGVLDQPAEKLPRRGPTVPIVGRVGAGALIEPEYEQADPLDEIEIPFTFADPIIAFEIAGDSMLPVYQDGEVVVCLRDQIRPTESYVGRRAVVRTAKGPRYLKELAKGSKRGLFNLVSWNASPITEVRIDWVGEIVAAVPGDAARRLRRAG